jgi:hypothetical protein
LEIVDVELNDVNGGSFRVYAKLKSSSPVAEHIISTVLEEEAEKISVEAILRFGDSVGETINSLRSFLEQLRKKGKKVYAYGASTRGSTLLQAVFPDGRALEYLQGVAERDEKKIGRTTVGTWLPIVSEQVARASAEYFLILPYHFWPTIMKREWSWLQGGGKCILPLPRPRLVELKETLLTRQGPELLVQEF